jgi:hypothetical protein
VALTRKHAAADEGSAAANRVGAAARRNRYLDDGVESTAGGVGEMASKSAKSWLIDLGKGPAGHNMVFAIGANAK